MTTASTYSDTFIDDADFAELVDKNLRSLASDDELKYLINHPDRWRSQLLAFKKRTEVQFTSSKSRAYNLYHSLFVGDISLQEYSASLAKEREWRCTAARFLQQVEMKIQEVKGLTYGQVN